jgi:hypothetical protein
MEIETDRDRVDRDRPTLINTELCRARDRKEKITDRDRVDRDRPTLIITELGTEAERRR